MDQTAQTNNNLKPQTRLPNIPSAFAVLLLFIAYPIGLIVMWLFTPWSKKLKFAITTIPAVLIITLAIAAVSSLNSAKRKYQVGFDEARESQRARLNAISKSSVKDENAPGYQSTAFLFIEALMENDVPAAIALISPNRLDKSREMIQKLSTDERINVGRAINNSLKFSKDLSENTDMANGEILYIDKNGNNISVPFILKREIDGKWYVWSFGNLNDILQTYSYSK